MDKMGGFLLGRKNVHLLLDFTEKRLSLTAERGASEYRLNAIIDGKRSMFIFNSPKRYRLALC